ncbi:MAG TPA: hypothetical protein VH701_04950 [Vicinamibacterales bacterium]|jgi:hypothetical protein
MPRHVNVLGLLYLVWGGLFLLAGAVVLALSFGALALIRYAAGEAGTELAAGLTAAAFGTLAAIALAWGGIHATTGAALRRHRPWSRPVAMVFGVLDLALLPFGTALGIYALWVLLHEEARAEFKPVGP